MNRLPYLALLLCSLLLASAAHAQIFYDNTLYPGLSAAYLTTDEIADDTPFSGTQHVAAFVFTYLNQGGAPVNATVRFYTVDSTTGGPGALIATVPVPNLAPANTQQLYTVNLDPSLQFDWIAAPGIYHFQTVTGGFVSIQFDGPRTGWWEAAGTSLNDFYDVTSGQLMMFEDSNASFFLQIANSELPSALSTLVLNPVTIKGGLTGKATMTLTGPAPSGGAVITLRSSKTNVAQVRSSITILEGATSATVPVKTFAVTTSTRVNVAASLNGITKNATLVVTP